MVVCAPWEVFLALSECQRHGSPVILGALILIPTKENNGAPGVGTVDAQLGEKQIKSVLFMTQLFAGRM